MRDYSSTKWLDEIHAEGVEVKKSCCYFCHQNCGVLAYVKDGKLIYAEGDPDHPTNAGGLCTRGNQAYTFVDNPSRINYPMKRAGEKGENKWERVSWDQALTEIAAKINQIKEESGAEAVAAAAGTLRTDDWARRRFLNLFGTPNGFHNALLCWIPTFMVETAINGWSPFETDLGASKCVILWGFNPGASSMPGMHGYTDLQRANGLKLIVVDPRYSETAAHADLWLPLRPGSDTALSMAMINVIMNEFIYDMDFVDQWCEGFDELRDYIEPYTPEWAAPLTWLDPELIRQAARMYATNRPGNIQWGCTWDQLGRTAGAGMHARSILRAICGNLDCPGGDGMPGPAAYVTDEELEANDRLPVEMRAKQIGSDKDKMNSEVGFCRKALQAFEENGISIEHMPSGIDTMTVFVHQAEFEGKEQQVISSIRRLAHPDIIDLESDLALIAVVGRGMKSNRGTAGRIFSALAHANINVRMIDQGSSELNIIIGVSNDDFDRAIKAIYDIFVVTQL